LRKAAPLTAAQAGQAAAGAPAFTVLAPAGAARWDAGTDVAAGSQMRNVLAGAGLPVPRSRDLLVQPHFAPRRNQAGPVH
jgi:hypothetical protein